MSKAGMLEEPGKALQGDARSGAQTKRFAVTVENYPAALLAGSLEPLSRHRAGPEGLGLPLKSPVLAVPSGTGCRET